jgi:hypothetical protein
VQLQISSLQYCWVGTIDLTVKVSVTGAQGQALSGTATYRNSTKTLNFVGSSATETMFGAGYQPGQTLSVQVHTSAPTRSTARSVTVGSPATNQC